MLRNLQRNSINTAQSAGAVEYANCISTEGKISIPPNQCPEYDTKPSDGDASVLELLGMWSILSFPGPF